MNRLMNQLMVVTNLGLEKYCDPDIYYYGEDELELIKNICGLRQLKKEHFND